MAAQSDSSLKGADDPVTETECDERHREKNTLSSWCALVWAVVLVSSVVCIRHHSPVTHTQISVNKQAIVYKHKSQHKHMQNTNGLTHG